jgi:histidinol-phosphate aminotransferase
MTSPRPRPGILEIVPYVAGKSGDLRARPVAKLSSNESPLGPSPLAVAAYREVAGELHRYPDGSAAQLRHAIARRHNLDPMLVVCGAGSDELIGLLMRAYAGPGDEVLYSRHGFLVYPLAALAAGAHPVAAPESQLTADVDALLQRVTSRTRLVFLANPNNPTGSYLSGAELRRLRDGLPPDVILVVDAAYAEYAETGDYDSGLEFATTTPNSVMLRTFSKLYGLASLRLGWLTAAPAIIDVMNRVRGPFNVSMPAQAAGVAALADEEHAEKARAHNRLWLPWLATELAALGLRIRPSLGNFLLVEFPQAGGRSATAANAHLEAAGVIPREVAAYGLPDCLRISIGLEDENRRLVAALAEFVTGRPSA